MYETYVNLSKPQNSFENKNYSWYSAILNKILNYDKRLMRNKLLVD